MAAEKQMAILFARVGISGLDAASARLVPGNRKCETLGPLHRERYVHIGKCLARLTGVSGAARFASDMLRYQASSEWPLFPPRSQYSIEVDTAILPRLGRYNVSQIGC